MRMTDLFAASLLGAAAVAGVPAAATPAPAPGVAPGPAAGAPCQLILYNGRVVTLLDPEPSPAPTAVAIAGERVAYVGDDAGARARAAAGARLVDLAGAVVVPGLIDSHAHLPGLGNALVWLDLRGAASAAEVADRVRAAAAASDGWILGRGWDQNAWPGQEFPTRALLDAAAPGRPVLLRRVDGHAAWVSSAALAAAGVTEATPDPAGGRLLRDADGRLTGVLIDNGVDLVGRAVPEPSPAERRRRLDLAVAHCLALGLTGVHDAGADADQVARYQELDAAGGLGLRLYVMLADDQPTLDALLPAGPWTSPSGLLTVRAVKLYADGALGSRGALLLADYADDPGNRGLAVTTPERLAEVAAAAGRAGFQVCTHAIGDAANRRVLDVYARVQRELGLRDPRWRIEHAQILAPADIPRFAELGVIAAMQPVHCTSDMDWVPARLGEARVAGAYAWRSLLASGARLCFGTDFPVEAADPLPGLYAARTRARPDGTPAGGWLPGERLSGREALALYTAGSAYAQFREHELGRVAPGFLADLTVLSGDPAACPPEELPGLRALLTIVGGAVRYEAPR